MALFRTMVSRRLTRRARRRLRLARYWHHHGDLDEAVRQGERALQLVPAGEPTAEPASAALARASPGERIVNARRLSGRDDGGVGGHDLHSFIPH